MKEAVKQYVNIAACHVTDTSVSLLCNLTGESHTSFARWLLQEQKTLEGSHQTRNTFHF